MRFRWRWIALPFAVAASQLWRFRDRLPERMATHFDGAGHPNGWMSRDGFFAFSFGMLAFMSLVFFGMGPLLRRVPPSLVNLPNRDYWLAPERRDATIAEIVGNMSQLGFFVLLFLVGVDELVFRANVAGGDLPTLPLWIGLGAFMALTVWWMVSFFRRFRLPK